MRDTDAVNGEGKETGPMLNPLIGRQASALQALFIAMGIVILLTWGVMPVLVRILRPWLVKSS